MVTLLFAVLQPLSISITQPKPLSLSPTKVSQLLVDEQPRSTSHLGSTPCWLLVWHATMPPALQLPNSRVAATQHVPGCLFDVWVEQLPAGGRDQAPLDWPFLV